MRRWSLHPRYLDAKELMAAWREAHLARAALAGRTRGYRAHPQLVRFFACASPADAIDAYLAALHAEAFVRGYAFDADNLRNVAVAHSVGSFGKVHHRAPVAEAGRRACNLARLTGL